MDVAEQLPDLERRWRGFWPSADHEGIAADVRTRLAAAIAAWRLEDVRPLAGGHIALVCAARQDGRGVVAKVNPRGHDDDAQLVVEGAALRFWQPTGAAVPLLARRDDGFTLLLEEILPGHTLDASGVPWRERLTLLGRLAARLHAAGRAPSAFPPLEQYALSWRRALAAEPAASNELEALLRSCGDEAVLLHADLHGGNALAAGRGWKAIDPHAVRGDRHADVWALIDPLAPALPAPPAAGDAATAAATARRWVAWYADAAGLDRARAAAWARVRARAEALAIEAQERPAPDDAAWAARLHRTADALA